MMGLPYSVHIRPVSIVEPDFREKQAERAELLEKMTSWCHGVIVDHWGWNEHMQTFCFAYEEDASKFVEYWNL